MRARAFLVVVTSMLCGGVVLPMAFAGNSGGGHSAVAVKDAAAKSDDDKYDPNNRTHISRYMETIVQGNTKFVSRDFPGAIEVYRKAIQLQPMNPLGHYLLGEAQNAAGNLAEAEASWTQADNVGDRDPGVKVKVLFCLADLRERQRKLDDAKTAWERYKQFGASHADAGAMPQSADARLLAIDEVVKLDKAYEIVRQRIAAERDGGK